MGGACSRKRDQPDNAEDLQRGVSGRSSKSISLRWPVNPPFRVPGDISKGSAKLPSLMELSVQKICETIDKYESFATLPRDLSQQIFNELVHTQVLKRESLQAFRDCALQDVFLGFYPNVEDSWLEILATQGPSLLAVDITGSAVTDSGLVRLQDCLNLQLLNFNYCGYISDVGLGYVAGFTNLTSLSFKRSNAITPAGLHALAGLVKLKSLDLERCTGIHGGLVHLKGLTNLESLNIGWCNCIKNSDIKHLAGLTNLKELQISRSKVTDGYCFTERSEKAFYT